MTAAALVEELRRRGIQLIPEGDRLRYRPASALSRDDVERLRASKAEVLALLTKPPADPPATWPMAYPWPDALPGLGPRRVGPFAPCAECDRWSWVRFGDRVLCLVCTKHHA